MKNWMCWLLVFVLCIPVMMASAAQDWYCPSCGRHNDGSFSFCPIDGVKNPLEAGGSQYGGSQSGNTGNSGNVGNPGYSGTPYNMGVPSIGSAEYGLNTHNIYVYWVQVQLKTLGYYIKYSGGVDVYDETGVLGSITADAIRKFQRDYGLSQTGTVNQALVEMIDDIQFNRGIAPAEVLIGGYYNTLPSFSGDGIQAGASGSNVRWVQECLNSLGYNCGTPDGHYGGQTQKQFLQFKRDNGFYAESKTIKLGHLRLMLEQYVQCGFDPSNLY